MINRAILMGRLCGDPELKTTPSGVSVTTFRIAVDRSYVAAGKERQADFIDVVAWRSSAEFVCRNFRKGSLIAVDGQLQSRNYQTKDGQNRTAIEVLAENVSFTGERANAAEMARNAATSNEQPQGGNFIGNAQNAPQAANNGYYTADRPPMYQQGIQYDPRMGSQGRIQDQFLDDRPY